jgi:hypothetical protein
MRRTLILAAALAIILLGLWGTAVIYFDESRLKGIVSERLSEQMGRRVEIAGALRFRLFPRPTIEAENLVMSGNGEAGSRAALRARRVSMSLQFLPLLQGELSPSGMELSGAVIRLDRKRSGAGGRDPMAAFRSGARLLAGRSLRLADLTLVLPGHREERPATLAIDFVELDRFSLDRTAAFRFRGDLGEPPLLEDVSVDGLLHVPASPEAPVRLRDIELEGQVAANGHSLVMTGDLTASGSDPFRLALAGGRLQVDDRSFDLSFNYHGGARPAFDLLLSGTQLDWLALHEFTVASGRADPASLLAAVGQRVDLRSQVQLAQLHLGSAQFTDVRIDLRSQGGGLGANVAAVFPGGLVEASGLLTEDAGHSLALDVSLAESGRVLEWLGQPAVVQGSGEAALTAAWPTPGGGHYRLEGEFSLWDGSLRIEREAQGESEGEGEDQTGSARALPYDRFSGEIRISPGYVELPKFELAGGELFGTGWAAIELPDGTIGGEIVAGAEGGAWQSLSGTLASPRLAPMGRAVLLEEEGEAAPPEGDESGQ